MIDNEYDHAVESIESKVYVQIIRLDRLHTGMRVKRKSVSDWVLIQSVSVDILWVIINISILGRSLTLAVSRNHVHAKCLNMSLLDPNNVACIGLCVERVSMSILGNLLASNINIIYRCKHTSEEHNVNYPLKCKKCSCFGFNSNFACLTCDGLWEHH